MSPSGHCGIDVEALLREAREELGRAESKITALFGVAGVVAAALLGGGIAGQWSPNSLHSPLARCLCWAGLALGTAGFAELVLGFRPRTRTLADEATTAPRYFGDIARYPSKEAFVEALHDSTASDHDRRADQVWHISHLVEAKYRHVNVALAMFGTAVAVSVLGLIIEQLA